MSYFQKLKNPACSLFLLLSLLSLSAHAESVGQIVEDSYKAGGQRFVSNSPCEYEVDGNYTTSSEIVSDLPTLIFTVSYSFKNNYEEEYKRFWKRVVAAPYFGSNTYERVKKMGEESFFLDSSKTIRKSNKVYMNAEETLEQVRLRVTKMKEDQIKKCGLHRDNNQVIIDKR